MLYFTLNLDAPKRIRREIFQGRKYIVRPATIIVPGVLNGSQGPLLYTKEENDKSEEEWNFIPITKDHPNDANGNPTSARSPEIINSVGLGFLFNTSSDDVLHAEAWFDEERTKQISPIIYRKLINNEPLEVSTGLHTNNVDAPRGAVWNGTPYVAKATDYKPDHLAVFESEIGACSNKDGCGINVRNAKKPKTDKVVAILERMYGSGSINTKGSTVTAIDLNKKITIHTSTRDDSDIVTIEFEDSKLDSYTDSKKVHKESFSFLRKFRQLLKALKQNNFVVRYDPATESKLKTYKRMFEKLGFKETKDSRQFGDVFYWNEENITENEIRENPTKLWVTTQLTKLDSDRGDGLRGFLDTKGNIYVWPANLYTHSKAAKLMGRELATAFYITLVKGAPKVRKAWDDLNKPDDVSLESHRLIRALNKEHTTNCSCEKKNVINAGEISSIQAVIEQINDILPHLDELKTTPEAKKLLGVLKKKVKILKDGVKEAQTGKMTEKDASLLTSTLSTLRPDANTLFSKKVYKDTQLPALGQSLWDFANTSYHKLRELTEKFRKRYGYIGYHDKRKSIKGRTTNAPKHLDLRQEKNWKFSSSNVKRIYYNDANNKVYVTYKNGDRWAYTITPSQAKRFFNIGSKGIWLWDNVKVRGKGNQGKHRVPAQKINRANNSSFLRKDRHVMNITINAGEVAALDKAFIDSKRAYGELKKAQQKATTNPKAETQSQSDLNKLAIILRQFATVLNTIKRAIQTPAKGNKPKLNETNARNLLSYLTKLYSFYALVADTDRKYGPRKGGKAIYLSVLESSKKAANSIKEAIKKFNVLIQKAQKTYPGKFKLTPAVVNRIHNILTSFSENRRARKDTELWELAKQKADERGHGNQATYWKIVSNIYNELEESLV